MVVDFVSFNWMSDCIGTNVNWISEYKIHFLNIKFSMKLILTYATCAACVWSFTLCLDICIDLSDKKYLRETHRPRRHHHHHHRRFASEAAIQSWLNIWRPNKRQSDTSTYIHNHHHHHHDRHWHHNYARESYDRRPFGKRRRKGRKSLLMAIIHQLSN